jgi:hypothetical protein
MKRKARGKRTGSRPRAGAKRTPRKRARPPKPAAGEDRGEIVELADEVAAQPGTGPGLSGGDLDADWTRAHLSGEEAVGGSVATPDQDVVDEIGRALGVEQAADAPVRTSDEILRDRDRLRWHLESDAADVDEAKEEGRAPDRPHRPRAT